MKKIREIFNPNKITISGKSIIVNTDSGKYVIKNKEKDVKSLFEYLNSRSFSNHPNIIDEYDNKIVYEYLKDINVPINQKALDMAKLLASLHNKTSHYIPIVLDDIKAIYENILGNILYLETYYDNIFEKALNEEFMRPSYYLLIRNQSKINGLIKYLKDELENWYNESTKLTKSRVVYNHNNLSINHFRENDNKYFISWDHYKIDSPVLDLINLYKNDFNLYDYSTFLNSYLKDFELLPIEKRLLFIVISIPNITYFNNDEMNNTIKVGKFINYINKTENLIKPYYPINKAKTDDK